MPQSRQGNSQAIHTRRRLSEVETTLRKLPKQDLEQFDQWYHDSLEEQWDEHIRRDIRSGKLDALRSEVRRSPVDERVITTLRSRLSPRDRRKLLQDIPLVPAWIGEVFRKVAQAE